MVVMNFLRALSDLGFYYTFAGLLAAIFGGRLALVLLLFQSACFALSSALRRSRIARTAALIPALLPVVLPAARADLIVSIPPVLYLVYLAWTDGYQLSWRRHAEQLSTFLRAFLAAAFLLIFLAAFLWDALLSAVIPTALVTVAASVLLTRSLRLEPEVYLQPTYQLVNFGGIALLALTALALGSEWAVRAAVSALGAVYNAVIAPLLLGLATVLGLLFSWLTSLLRMLAQKAPQGGEELSVENMLEVSEEVELAEIPPNQLIELLNQILAALGILAAVVVLVLFFRWLARPRYAAERGPELHRSSIPEQRRTAGRARAGTYAYRIRRQY